MGIGLQFFLPLQELEQDQPVTINTKFTFYRVLDNNLKVNLSISTLGIFTIGLYPAIVLMLNGFVFGGYLKLAFYRFDDPFTIIVKATLPHCFEFFATWIAGAIGFYGFIIFVRLFRQDNLLNKVEIGNLIKSLILVIILTIIAAFMEVNVSIPWATGEFK